jgi:hypothetical protein
MSAASKACQQLGTVWLSARAEDIYKVTIYILYAREYILNYILSLYIYIYIYIHTHTHTHTHT